MGNEKAGNETLLKNFIKVICVALFVLSIPAQSEAAEVSTKPLIVIDPGHGGMYSGTSGYSGSTTGYYEKKANLEVSLRLRSVLQSRGYEVKMTRSTDKHFSSVSSSEDLKARTKLSNTMVAGRNDNSIFVSVHHNASSSPLSKGYETYYYNKDYLDPDYPPDPMQVKYSRESGRLAQTTHQSVISSGANSEGRGIIHNSLYVTRNAQVPSILSEVEYMSNPTAEKKVKTATFQQGIAVAIANGVDKYFKIFQVKNEQGTVIKTFTSKSEALTYAGTQQNVTVFDKRAGAIIFDNTSQDYQAYHTSVELNKRNFSTEKEAIAYAANYSNTRVVHHPTGEIKWSNYLPKKYSVLDPNQNIVEQEYQRTVAREVAESLPKATLENTETKSTLWSSVLPQSFEVRHKVKGTLKSFYDKTLAQNYAALWPGTTVYDTSTKTVTYTNPVQITPNKVSKTVSGTTRYLTAIEVSKSLYPSGFSSSKSQKTVVLATAFGYADALSAGPLAMYYDNAPILLNPVDKLNTDVLNEIKRLKSTKVVLVGGEVALSANVVNQLKKAIPTIVIERVSGETRYETNEVINSKLPKPKGIFIASGTNFPDALSATSIAVMQGWHVVLSNGTSYTDAINDQVYSKPTVIVGGKTVVSTGLEEKIKVQAGADNVTRLAGIDRYGTNAALIKHFTDTLKSPTIVVSTGTNYPDALVSSSLSGKYQAPLFIVGKSISETLRPTLTSYLAERVTSTSLYSGGVVPNAVKAEIDKLK